jgi:hypothetical protein
MAINKFRTQYPTGQTLYIFLWNEDEEIAYPVGETFETYGTSSRTASDYAISMTEEGSTGYYTASWPSWVERGHYDVVVKIQAGASPADSDTGFGPTERYWTGTSVSADVETSPINICNRALAKAGGGDNVLTITSLSDTDKTSVLCNLLYTPCRRQVLKRMKPQECLYYADLGAESSFSGEKAEWDYVFDLPSDNLIVCRQTDERYHKIDHRYEIKQNKLFTNTYSNEDGDSAYIEYVKNETDADVFSEEVANAIATLLAAEITPRITGGEWGWKRRQELLEEFESLILLNSTGINKSMQYNDEQEQYRESHYSWLGDRNLDTGYDW